MFDGKHTTPNIADLEELNEEHEPDKRRGDGCLTSWTKRFRSQVLLNPDVVITDVVIIRLAF